MTAGRRIAPSGHKTASSTHLQSRRHSHARDPRPEVTLRFSSSLPTSSARLGWASCFFAESSDILAHFLLPSTRMPRNCPCDNCQYTTTGPGRDCFYGSGCTNWKCWSAHPSSAGGRSKAGNKASACRDGINCTRGNCEFAHPSPARKCCAKAGAPARPARRRIEGGASSEQALVPSFAGLNLDSSGGGLMERVLRGGDTAKKWKAIKELLASIDRLRLAGLQPETVIATGLGAAHAFFMGELFLREGCWTGNFSTSILEAKAKRIIDQDQLNLLVSFNAAFNQQARHPGPAKPPAPNLLKTHQGWLRSPEYNQYFRNGGSGGRAARGRITQVVEADLTCSCGKRLGSESSLRQHKESTGH